VADGQIDRAAERLGLIAAAGELATLLGVTLWREGEARAVAAWALARWIDDRGGTEPTEVRQASEQVRFRKTLFGWARLGVQQLFGGTAIQAMKSRQGMRRPYDQRVAPGWLRLELRALDQKD